MEFSVKNKNLLIQNLVEIQQQSFNNLLCVGLKRQLLQLNCIENKTRDLKLIFHAKNYKFVLPDITPKEAILKAKSFASALFVPVEYRTKKTIGVYWVLLGHLPFMTKRGHFIINGVPRVVLNQMVRSPGLYYKTTANLQNLSNEPSVSQTSYEEKESSQNAPVFYSDIIPNRGTWLRLEIDRKKNIWIRMKRVDKIPMMLFLQALGYDSQRVEKLLYSRKFLNCDYLFNTEHPANSNLALKKIKVEIEQQKILKLAALEALNEEDPDIAKQLDYIEKTTTPAMGKDFLFQSFFNPTSYDLSPIGRFQLNKKLNLSIPNDYTVLTEFDIYFATKELIKRASTMSNSEDIDHLQTRRIRSCGELLEIQLGEGIERLQKIIIDKISNTNLKRFSKPSKKRIIKNRNNRNEKSKPLKNTDIQAAEKTKFSKLSNIHNIKALTHKKYILFQFLNKQLSYNNIFLPEIELTQIKDLFRERKYYFRVTNPRFVKNRITTNQKFAKNIFFFNFSFLKKINCLGAYKSKICLEARGSTNRRFVKGVNKSSICLGGFASSPLNKSLICKPLTLTLENKQKRSVQNLFSYIDFLRLSLLKIYEGQINYLYSSQKYYFWKSFICKNKKVSKNNIFPFVEAISYQQIVPKINIFSHLPRKEKLQLKPISKNLVLSNHKWTNQFATSTDKTISSQLTSFNIKANYANLGSCANFIYYSALKSPTKYIIKSNQKLNIIKQKIITKSKTIIFGFKSSICHNSIFQGKASENIILGNNMNIMRPYQFHSYEIASRQFFDHIYKADLPKVVKPFNQNLYKSIKISNQTNKKLKIIYLRSLFKSDSILTNTKEHNLISEKSLSKFLNCKRFCNFKNLVYFYKFITKTQISNLFRTASQIKLPNKSGNKKFISQISSSGYFNISRYRQFNKYEFDRFFKQFNLHKKHKQEYRTHGDFLVKKLPVDCFLNKKSPIAKNNIFSFFNKSWICNPKKIFSSSLKNMNNIPPSLEKYNCLTTQLRVHKRHKLQKKNIYFRYSKPILERNYSLNKNLKLVETSIQNLITTNSINGAFQELFGLNPLSQFMDQINPLSEITHKRRISSMGPGGVNRDNASMEVRSIHPTHYGRICPIETPEGHNAGLVNSPTLYARINNYGFLETPFFKVNSGQIQTKAVYLTAQKEQKFKVSPPDLSCSELSFLPLGPTKMEGEVPMRKDFKFQRMIATQIEFIGVSPLQMISVATSLIPFLEHDDANRALMGSNMQRQAVPLLTAESPIVGTGLEGRVIADSSYIIQTKASGIISYVSNEVIIVQTFY